MVIAVDVYSHQLISLNDRYNINWSRFFCRSTNEYEVNETAEGYIVIDHNKHQFVFTPGDDTSSPPIYKLTLWMRKCGLN